MEEDGDKGKLIVGGIVLLIILLVGFFVVRGIFFGKPAQKNTTTVIPSAGNVTPTPVVNSVSPMPTGIPAKTQTSGNTIYYYQSQGSSSQSQNQDGTNQSQSQTLPNGMTQSQNQ